MNNRILPNHTRPSLSLLHAAPPPHMFVALQYILPLGRARRGSRAILPAIDPIRCRLRHGYGSVHDGLPPCLSLVSLATMGVAFPGADQSRSGESLHSYVCDIDNGRIRAEP